MVREDGGGSPGPEKPEKCAEEVDPWNSFTGSEPRPHIPEGGACLSEHGASQPPLTAPCEPSILVLPGTGVALRIWVEGLQEKERWVFEWLKTLPALGMF